MLGIDEILIDRAPRNPGIYVSYRVLSTLEKDLITVYYVKDRKDAYRD